MYTLRLRNNVVLYLMMRKVSAAHGPNIDTQSRHLGLLLCIVMGVSVATPSISKWQTRTIPPTTPKKPPRIHSSQEINMTKKRCIPCLGEWFYIFIWKEMFIFISLGFVFIEMDVLEIAVEIKANVIFNRIIHSRYSTLRLRCDETIPL